MASEREGTARGPLQTATTRPSDLPAGVLVVGSLAGSATADIREIAGSDWVPAADGIDALRLLSRPEVRDRVGVVLASSRLPDTAGVALLERVATLLPRIARVLLVEAGDEVPGIEEQLHESLDAVWPAPVSSQELLARVEQERPMLERIQVLNQRLDATRSALERLEHRYRDMRRVRDLVTANVQHVLTADDAPARDRLARWWRDHSVCVKLAESGCPLHREPVAIDTLMQRVLGRLPTSCSALTSWSAPLPGHAVLDVGLATRGLVRLLAGLMEVGEPGATLHCASALLDAGIRVLRLQVDVAATTVLGAMHEIDEPFARLPGGALDFLSMDLVVARALLEAQDLGIAFVRQGPSMMVEVRLPVSPAARRPIQTVSPLPVVPGTNPTL